MTWITLCAHTLKGVAEVPLQVSGWSGRHLDNAYTGVLVVENRPSVSPPSGDASPSYQPMGGCFAFLIWGIGGALILVSFWVQILRNAPWRLSFLDAIYWATVLVMLAARWISFTRYSRADVTGAVSDPRDLKRYVVVLLGTATAGWVVAQSIGV